MRIGKGRAGLASHCDAVLADARIGKGGTRGHYDAVLADARIGKGGTRGHYDAVLADARIGKGGAGGHYDAVLADARVGKGRTCRYHYVSKAGYCQYGGQSKNGKRLHSRGLPRGMVRVAYRLRSTNVRGGCPPLLQLWWNLTF
jgi:hypothetical protein